MMSAPRFQLTPGEQIYKYQLRNHIGGGGFGDVWLAHDHSISRDVAVKVLDSSQTSIDERLREARIGNRLNHQNLVKVHYADVVQHNHAQFVIIAMDYHVNGSILGKLNAGNFVPCPDVLRHTIDILRGLEYLHEQGLFHSDIKPPNILIGDHNEGILTDYGITCQSPDLQPVRPISAYKLHIAPEVLFSGQINVQTDIYQVGLTAFRLLNGIGSLRDRFNSVGQSEYYRLVQEGQLVQANDFQPFIPTSLKRVISKSVANRPEARYQSAVEMRRALERLSFPGYWTCDSTGKFIGNSGNYQYHFSEVPRSSSSFDFTSYKTNKISSRQTQISQYSGKRLSQREVKQLKERFMLYVVTGDT